MVQGELNRSANASLVRIIFDSTRGTEDIDLRDIQSAVKGCDSSEFSESLLQKWCDQKTWQRFISERKKLNL